MTKVENEVALQKRKAAEARQLARLEKESARKIGKNYFIFLMIILTIIYVVDELASNIKGTMQPYVILDMYNVPSILDDAYAPAAAKLTFLSILSYFFMLLAPFYKALADKYGRKLFLVINTTMMGAGLAVCMIAPNIAVYVIGILMVTFVMSNDMQVMYIMETAPVKHRAKLCSITKAIALVGVSLIGVFRSLFYDPAVPSSWRYVFAIPAIFGIVVGLGCIPFIRETPAFVKERMAFLKSSDEERAENAKKAAEEEAAEKSKNGGVKEALRFLIHDKQLSSVCIAAIVFCLATGVTSYYSTILEAASGTGVITSDDVSFIIIFFPFINGLVTFFAGFISDGLGRKKGCMVLSVITVIGLVGFILGSRFGWAPAFIGASYGVFIGGLWSVSDTIILVIPSESTPTELRASVVGTLTLICNIAMAVSFLIIVGGMNLFGTANLGIFCLCTVVPFLAISIFLLQKNVKETAGNDLSEIGE